MTRVGVIGTHVTVDSDAVGQMLRQLSPGVEVISQACPLFVPLVENGMFDGKIVDDIVEHYLSGLREAQLHSLILSCTHYPLLKGVIANFMGSSVKIVECSDAIASQVALDLRRLDLENPSSTGEVQYFVTDQISRFDALAKICMQDGVAKAQKVDVA